ncbi:MAG: hypothetical protein J6B98_03905 [Bacilli bacterium]|nr:hypothetical protein [Bacilli bacterium]
MIIKNDWSMEERTKIINFKNKYIDLYPDYLQNEINSKLLFGITNDNDIINQIYAYLELIPDEINPYLGFLEHLKQYFNLKKINILEIGSGCIPMLAFYIYDLYKNKIDIQEPNIIFSNIIKGNIFKEKFTETTNIDKYDLIIGFNPCSATESMIKNAIKNNKNFAIALCGCCFLPDEFIERNSEKWHEYLFKLAKDLGKDNYEIVMSTFPINYQRKEPIITGIYKKSMSK